MKKKKKRGRPPLPKGEARTERFWFRCSKAELKQIETNAKRARQELSTWARDRLLKGDDADGF